MCAYVTGATLAVIGQRKHPRRHSTCAVPPGELGHASKGPVWKTKGLAALQEHTRRNLPVDGIDHTHLHAQRWAGGMRRRPHT